MFNITKKSIQFGAHTLTLETGEISRQADSAVLVSYGDTVVLVAVTSKSEVKEGQDFFTLEKTTWNFASSIRFFHVIYS